MQKEKLTFGNIKQDLIAEIKTAYVLLAEKVFVFVGVLLLILLYIKNGIPFNAAYVWFLCCCGEAALLVLIIKGIIKILTLHKGFKNLNDIVKDKLICGEFITKGYGKSRVTYYRLTFSQYGDYRIPYKNYKWSTDFAMSDKGVYNYAKNGDEFYLVLSKPHNGKILLAYNTKMFEMD